MIIWGAMAIPLVVAIALLIFFHHRTTWWEFAIPFAISTILILGFKFGTETSQTRDVEFWGGWVTEAHWYEDWNEYIHRTCYQCTSYDKNGACTGGYYYDCSYVRYHPEHWRVYDSNGGEHGVKKSVYDYFVKLFGHRPIFVDLGRNHHTNDGDLYKVVWPKTPEAVEPVVTVHRYENRVQAAKTVFKFQDVGATEITEYGLFSYPSPTLFDYPTVLGDCGSTTEAGNESFRYYNATLGRSKQLRIWVLCFRGHGQEAGILQESLWAGGNKNEAVITIGLNSEDQVEWAYVFSWSEAEMFKVEIRDHLVSQGSLDLVEAADFAAGSLKTHFVRKPFSEFSYLKVEPPTWAIITTFILTLLVNVGLSAWLVHNEFHDLPSRRRRY